MPRHFIAPFPICRPAAASRSAIIYILMIYRFPRCVKGFLLFFVQNFRFSLPTFIFPDHPFHSVQHPCASFWENKSSPAENHAVSTRQLFVDRSLQTQRRRREHVDRSAAQQNGKLTEEKNLSSSPEHRQTRPAHRANALRSRRKGLQFPGNLTFPHRLKPGGITVTDSRGFSPHSPCRLARQELCHINLQILF